MYFLSPTNTAANQDYTPLTSPETDLIFDAGSSITNNSDTTTVRCFTVEILNDDEVEEGDAEQFVLGLISPTGLIVVDTNRDDSTATVNIADDDVGEQLVCIFYLRLCLHIMFVKLHRNNSYYHMCYLLL